MSHCSLFILTSLLTNDLRFMGDSWSPGNLMSSTYLWLPLIFSGKDRVSMVSAPYSTLSTEDVNVSFLTAFSTKLDPRSQRWQMVSRAQVKSFFCHVVSADSCERRSHSGMSSVLRWPGNHRNRQPINWHPYISKDSDVEQWREDNSDYI